MPKVEKQQQCQEESSSLVVVAPIYEVAGEATANKAIEVTKDALANSHKVVKTIDEVAEVAKMGHGAVVATK